MQGNIRIVLTLSVQKNKNRLTVTTDWIENKINKVHNAYTSTTVPVYYYK